LNSHNKEFGPKGPGFGLPQGAAQGLRHRAQGKAKIKKDLSSPFALRLTPLASSAGKAIEI